MKKAEREHKAEEWRDVPAYGGHYQASNLGNIRSKDRVVRRIHSTARRPVDFFYRGKELTKIDGKDGYYLVRIGINKKKYAVQVGRLVLLAFIGPPSDGQVCRHLDGNPKNNTPSNLAWGTHLENMADRKRHGRYASGRSHPMSKYSEEVILSIRHAPPDVSGVYLHNLYGVSRTHISRLRRSGANNAKQG